jgi:dienelactone hydrolase
LRLRTIVASVVIVVAATVWVSSRANPPRWAVGEFQSNGKAVQEFHCAPSSAGPHPAVIILHGAGYRGALSDQFETICTALADRGYYAEFIEYYDTTENSDPATAAADDFHAWFAGIHSGIDALGKNPAVDPKRIAVMGFSQGAYLAIGCGAMFPNQVAAVVEYYGGLLPNLRDKASAMPPTLIIHGDGDSMIPVSEANDLDALLTKDGRAHQVHIYHQAEHGFNFRRPGVWYDKDDADDAWKRTLEFLDRNLKG